MSRKRDSAKKDNSMTENYQSKSSKKREAAGKQLLGEKLVTLGKDLRKHLNLPPELADALELMERISDREAVRRNRQYIGRLMREVDFNEVARDLEEKIAKGVVNGTAALEFYKELKNFQENIF